MLQRTLPSWKKISCTSVAGALALVYCFAAQASLAQTVDAGTLSRDIAKDLPQFEKRGTPKAATPEPEQLEEKQTPSAKPPIWETDKGPSAQELSMPIKKIFLQASHARKDIFAYLKEHFSDFSHISVADLDEIRSFVWGLYLKEGYLAHVSYQVIPGRRLDQDSVLSVKITEIKVRNIILSSGDLKLASSVEEHLKNVCRRSFYEGNIINLERMDARIKSRMRLGDYDLKISLAPVDEKQVDIKLFVSEKPPKQTSYLMQYDNSGVRSFGKDRFIFGVSSGDAWRAGDQIEVLALKTVDMGRADIRGVYYGRGEYTLPISSMDFKTVAWGSALNYKAIKGTTSNSEATGYALEVGTGVIKPLYTSDTAVMDGRVDFVAKWVRDFFDEDTETSDKTVQAFRLKFSGQRSFKEYGLTSYAVGATTGRVDLSGNESSLAQDKATARTSGYYAKFTTEASWQNLYGAERRWDVRANMQGQLAVRNLNSMEKFSLGGSTGLRAFGSGEASGDHGVLGTFEVGYRVLPWLRAATFYEVGGIRRYVNPWTDESTPDQYILQDVGVSLMGQYQSLSAGVTFAQQVGKNPGLTNGLDSDNLSRRYRALATLGYRF